MNIFGIGGPELLLILAVGLFVLGPKRLMEGIREAKRMYTELKRQRDQLQALVEQAIELEELKKEIGADKLAEGAKEIEKSLSLDQMLDTDTDSRPGAVRYQRRVPSRGSTNSTESIPDIKLDAEREREADSTDNSAGGARA